MLLWLYPPGFRQQYERDMLLAFRDGWDERRGTRAGVWRFAWSIMRDFSATVPRAWWSQVFHRRGVRPQTRKERQLMQNLVKDIRYAARGLARRPGMAVIAVTALALGIGLTTAMFSIVNGVVLRGLPVEDPQEIMAINRINPMQGPSRLLGRIHDFRDLRERQTTFEDLVAMSLGPVNVSFTDAEPEFLTGALVTANLFSVIGMPPLMGRGFLPADEERGAPAVVIVGHRLWQDQLGGEAAALGRTIRVDGAPATIVGIMPEGFEFPVNQQLWRPLQVDYLATPRGEGPSVFPMLGRLKDGVSMSRAQADLARIMVQLGEEYPETNEGMSVVIGPYTRELIGYQTASLLFTMLGAVGLVLLIACANVANLLLARASLRTKEVAVRTALGASRGRVIVQLLVESTVIAVAGAVVGIGIAQLGVGLFNDMLRTLPQGLPFWFDIRIDPSALLFVVALTVGASLLSGLLPAFRVSGTDVNAVLKDESRGSSSLRIGRLSRSLVVMEVAFSCALLIAAGLMVKSVTNLANIEYDFATEHVFVAGLALSPTDYPTNESRVAFFRDLVERLEAEPGVLAASTATNLPVVGFGNARFAHEGETYQGDRDYPNTRLGAISPEYFVSLETNVVEGRNFSALDDANALPVVIVDRAFVAQHFPGGSAIGRRLSLRGTFQQGSTRERDERWLTIVGVAPDLYLEMDAFILPQAAIYVPMAQRPPSAANVIVRTQGDPLDFTAAARRAVRSLDAEIPLSQVASLADTIGQAQFFFQIFGVMFTIFGGVALFLATVGLYGVLSFSVNQRTHEVGLRIALGATSANVMGLVMRQGFRQLALGLGVGVVMAFGLARMISLLLYDVAAADATVFVAIVVVLAATGLLASFLPARRATRVDPTVAMRAE
ncbi:MAG: ABC transporter permease [Gemmatimonadetes bacterium]|nr:ABC transporter permease [Gemmatimonadota bacterium]